MQNIFQVEHAQKVGSAGCKVPSLLSYGCPALQIGTCTKAFTNIDFEAECRRKDEENESKKNGPKNHKAKKVGKDLLTNSVQKV